MGETQNGLKTLHILLKSIMGKKPIHRFFISPISNPEQEANAAASILWDNAFSESTRVPFKVPDKVTWGQVFATLNMKWRKEVKSKFDLSERAMLFLGHKLFRGSTFNLQSVVTWNMFNRESLPNRNFTFWQWFESVMSLMKTKYCIKHWNDRAIVGFISKNDCESILLRPECGDGAFMMRFSDSELGGLTVSFTYGLRTIIIALF